MNEPKVSIIVPVYNCKKYIRKCLNSLINQEYNNFEIIIVDDGCNDGTERIVEKYRKYSNIQIITQENQGSSAARKNGLIHISEDSKYFCFCDADDYFDTSFLTKMVNISEKNNSDITQCNYWKFIGKHKYNDYVPNCLITDNVYNKNQIMNSLYKSYFGISDFPGYLHTKLYKRKYALMIINLPVIVKFMADDLSMNIRLLPLTNIIATTSEKLYYYRVGGGTSRFMPNFMDDYLAYHRLQLQQIKKLQLPLEFLYYSQIEIINVLHSWLLMMMDFNRLNKSQFNTEIKKWLRKKEIFSAMNNKDILEKWDNLFYRLKK